MNDNTDRLIKAMFDNHAEILERDFIGAGTINAPSNRTIGFGEWQEPKIELSPMADEYKVTFRFRYIFWH